MGDQLILGPFQGPVACTRIAFDKGVCGNAWKQAKTILVDNVHEYPGHIACSALSNAEIVVPVIKNGVVTALLDVDSEHFAAFDATDEDWLEKIVKLLP
jgi:GAF domain-containing protein